MSQWHCAQGGESGQDTGCQDEQAAHDDDPQKPALGRALARTKIVDCAAATAVVLAE